MSKKDDGEISGTLFVNHRQYERGEQVEVTFMIKNISEEPIVLFREDAPVLDLILTSTPTRRSWTHEVGPSNHELVLAPEDTYTIIWTLEELDTGPHTIIGYWWSDDLYEFETVVVFLYGPARY